MQPETFRCLVTDKTVSGASLNLLSLPLTGLPVGDVEIAVHWSSLNYKDALAATGHVGVVKTFPHIPGIDAAGVVVRSSNDAYQTGDEVLVTGYELGQAHWGGWSERIRVPAEWVVPLPPGLTLRQAMIYGTAGFTAAQCVLALERNDIHPSAGEVVVSGATGGVGSLALRMLAHLGYQVVAVTGKQSATARLLALGAARVISRAEFVDESKRPLLNARYAGGVDTVGGPILSSLLRSTKYGGCIAACGLVAGTELNLTLYPFLLRGITLAGIASADCPRARRLTIWNLLSTTYRPPNFEQWVTEITLDKLPQEVPRILAGQQCGRVIVKIHDAD